jgi:hypothetical protein
MGLYSRIKWVPKKKKKKETLLDAFGKERTNLRLLVWTVS